MSVTRQMVLDTFHNAGTITHVEFIQINVIPGLFQNIYKSAFIYFDKVNSHDIIWTTISEQGTFIISISPTEYWLCLQNFNLLQITNHKYTYELEQILKLQSSAISRQSNAIQQQNKIISELTAPNIYANTHADANTDADDSFISEFIVCYLDPELFHFYMEHA